MKCGWLYCFLVGDNDLPHYVIMGVVASQITGVSSVCSAAVLSADQRKHQRSASLALVRSPVNSPHKWPVTRKMFPFNDITMRLPHISVGHKKLGLISFFRNIPAWIPKGVNPNDWYVIKWKSIIIKNVSYRFMEFPWSQSSIRSWSNQNFESMPSYLQPPALNITLNKTDV